MGTPANGKVEIGFDHVSTAEKILNWVKKANSGKLGGSFAISLSKDGRDAGFLAFELDSNRVQNLEWQITKFRGFAEPIEDIRRFESSYCIYTPYEYFDKDE